MISVRTKLCFGLLLSSVLSAGLPAAGVTLHGKVSDNTGKPLRGVLVKAATKEKSISRFTQADGRFELIVPSGSYLLSTDAYGYTTKRQTVDATQPQEINLTLAPKWDLNQLTGAELEQLIPDDTQGRLIKATCIDCHDFNVVEKRRGMTAPEWTAFIPEMTRQKRPEFWRAYSPLKMNALGVALEKYFGPNSPYMSPDADPPSREQVKHPALSDTVLTATYREYTIPTGADSDRPESFPHSVEVDKRDAWVAEVGYNAEKIGRLDLETEKFTEYPVPIVYDPVTKRPISNPHTGVIGKDGRIWETMATAGLGVPKLISLDPQSGALKTYTFPGKPQGAHTPVLDQAGNLWISTNGAVGHGEVWFFDVKTEQFKSYEFPTPASYPAGSDGDWRHVAGDPEHVTYATYHVGVDSKGKVWANSMQMGILVRIDPATGETKEYFPPDCTGSRGLAIDQQDNVWFSDFFHHRLGMLDPKTGEFKMYRLPTPGASVYGIVQDRKTGYIWLADFTGNHITRFDPKTEEFAEYPLPSRPSYPRFIDLGPDGRIWFTEYWNGKIGVLDPGPGIKQSASR